MGFDGDVTGLGAGYVGKRKLLQILRGSASIWWLGPLALFANGGQGVWLDPTDMDTMFQDSAGTTPVTGAGDPVGLMLDKSQGLVLGPELVTNGTFDADTDWTKNAGVTITGGQAVFTSVASGGLTQVLSATDGKRYEVHVTISGLTGGSIAARIGSGSFTFMGEGENVLRITASGSGALVLAVSTGGVSCTIDNVSVREIPGNHASQSTTASRPVLQQTGGGLWYLDFDGVDDFLELSNTLNLNSGLAALRLEDTELSTAPTGIISGATDGYILSSGAGRLLQKNNGGTYEAVDTPGSISLESDQSLAINIDGGTLNTYKPGDETRYFNSNPVMPTGLANTKYIGAFNAGTVALFQGRFYGIILRETSVTDSDRRLILQYLEGLG